jgi:hypothetical protein
MSLALSGSQHLEFLLNNKLLQPVPSTSLQRAYQIRTIVPQQMEELKKINAAGVPEEQRTSQVMKIIEDPSKTQPIQAQSDTAEEQLLLEKRSGKLVERVLKLPGLSMEIERAVDQIQRLMAKEAQEKEAKQEPTPEEKEKKH